MSDKILAETAPNVYVLKDNNGIEQAKTLADNLWLRDPRSIPGLILTSPLKRAKQTAELVGRNAIRIVEIDTLRAGGGGDLEKLPYKHWYEVPEQELKRHGAEDAEMLYARAQLAIMNIIKSSKDYDLVLLIAHGGIYQMIKANALGLRDPIQGYSIPMPKNGEVIRLDIDNKQ